MYMCTHKIIYILDILLFYYNCMCVYICLYLMGVYIISVRYISKNCRGSF